MQPPLAGGRCESVEAHDRTRLSAVDAGRERRNDRGEHEARRLTMKTIVVGYDDSDPAKRALERAAELATALGAKVIVTSVAPMLVGRAGGPVDPADPPEEHKRELMRAASFLADRGIEADLDLGLADPASHIVELAEQRGADLIVVGTHEPGLLERLLGLSVSRKVERKSHCDVLIVH
jgi:nucleotide-binding universal stress UspA family protein